MPRASRAAVRPSLALEAAALALGSLVTHGAGLLGTVLLARVLTKSDMGAYQQLLLVHAVVTSLLLGGVPAALLYFFPRAASDEERSRWTFDAYVLLTAAGVVAAVLLVALREPLSDALGTPQLAPALVAFAPYVFFSFVQAVMPNALIAVRRGQLASVLNAVGAALWLGAVLLVTATGGTVRDVALALSVAGAISAAISVVAVLRIVGVRLGPIRWRPLLGYGVPLALTGLVGMLGYQLDRVIVAASFTPTEFAVYALGAVQVPIALLVRQAVNSVLIPVLSERWAAEDPFGMAGLWCDAMRKTSLVILPMFVFLMVTSEAVVVTLFGDAYADSAGIFRVYLALLPLNVATWGLIPMAAGRTGMNVYGSIVLLVVNAAVALALIGPLGLYGAAAATPVAGLAVAVYFLARSSKLLGVPVAAIMPLGMLVVNLAVSAVAGLPVLAILLLELPPPVELVVTGAVYVPLCVALLRLTGRLEDEDWRRLRAMVLRRRALVPDAGAPQ